MSSNSTNINHITNVIKPRNKSLGLNLSETQSKIAAPSNLKSEFIIIKFKMYDSKDKVVVTPHSEIIFSSDKEANT